MKTEQQNYTKEQAEILKKEFYFGNPRDNCQKTKLSDIIDWIIDHVKKKKDYDAVRECIRKYWFTKQIEKWKENNKTDEEPSNDKLMDIVKEDLKIRTANTMLALQERKDINEKNIWFNNEGEYSSIVKLQNDDNIILGISDFNDFGGHASPPYKPFFMENSNDEGKLNGVCIYKHGNYEEKTKWIIACFKNDFTKPQCRITFKTNETDKITKVEIENKKDKNSESTTYTISLDDKGQVTKITKEGEELNKENYIEEINKPLFEDNINKHLTENIECELDDQQKAVFDKIKEHIGIKIEKDNEKEEENKEEEKKADLNNSNKEKESENGEVKEIKNNQATYSFCGMQNNCMGTPVDENSNITFHCFCCDI